MQSQAPSRRGAGLAAELPDATIGAPMSSERLSYTLEEARGLLPRIRSVLLQLATERHRYDAAHAAMHDQMRGNGDPVHGREELQRQEVLSAQIQEGIDALIAHLESLGIQLRDLENGLVDIPTLRDGQPAWFCWRLADAELAFWHTTREGFANRKPL
jgi:hypothetical protein